MLKPARFSLYPPEEWSEGYIFETVREKFIWATRREPSSCITYPGSGTHSVC